MTHRLSCWCSHGGASQRPGAAGSRRLWGRRRTRLRGGEQGHGGGRTFGRRVPGPPRCQVWVTPVERVTVPAEGRDDEVTRPRGRLERGAGQPEGQARGEAVPASQEGASVRSRPATTSRSQPSLAVSRSRVLTGVSRG